MPRHLCNALCAGDAKRGSHVQGHTAKDSGGVSLVSLSMQHYGMLLDE